MEEIKPEALPAAASGPRGRREGREGRRSVPEHPTQTVFPLPVTPSGSPHGSALAGDLLLQEELPASSSAAHPTAPAPLRS